MILAKFRTAMLAAIPGLDAPKKAFFRVARNVAGRFNLQPVDPVADQTRDLENVEVCPGVPGVTSEPTPGEEAIVAFVGKDGRPYIIARASEQMPGHTPIEVRHDATTAIRFVSKTASAGAKVYVGSAPTVPVALAGPLGTYLNALELWAIEVDAVITAAGIGVAVPTYAASVTARATAASNIGNIAATNLEAK